MLRSSLRHGRTMSGATGIPANKTKNAIFRPTRKPTGGVQVRSHDLLGRGGRARSSVHRILDHIDLVNAPRQMKTPGPATRLSIQFAACRMRLCTVYTWRRARMMSAIFSGDGCAIRVLTDDEERAESCRFETETSSRSSATFGHSIG